MADSIIFTGQTIGAGVSSKDPVFCSTTGWLKANKYTPRTNGLFVSGTSIGFNGLIPGLAGLTPDTDYYLDDEGGLTVTRTSTKIGRSRASTELFVNIGYIPLLKNEWHSVTVAEEAGAYIQFKGDAANVSGYPVDLRDLNPADIPNITINAGGLLISPHPSFILDPAEIGANEGAGFSQVEITNDGASQISSVNLVGLCPLNSDSYVLYLSISLVGPDYIVSLYSDAARTVLVSRGTRGTATGTVIMVEQTALYQLTGTIGINYSIDDSDIELEALGKIYMDLAILEDVLVYIEDKRL
jgi:hypothetical protein